MKETTPQKHYKHSHRQKDILNNFVVLKKRADQHECTKVDGAGDRLIDAIHNLHKNFSNP